MPSELAKQPYETHQRLLNGPQANTHMPLVGNEVAYLPMPSRPWVTWRGLLAFASGVLFLAIILGAAR